MQVKFQKGLDDYSHLVMFDLATRVTGVCVWDIAANRPSYVTTICVSENADLPAAELYEKLDEMFKKLEQNGIDLEKVLVYQEAMPTQLRRGKSTIQTFISLARSHAVLDLYTCQNGLAIYDYCGIYPVSTHAYLRKRLGLNKDQKIDKQAIKDFVENEFGLRELSFDEADAVFLAQTFVDVKWNKDIEEEIRNVKRHIKQLKDERRIAALQKEQQRLSDLQLVTE